MFYPFAEIPLHADSSKVRDGVDSLPVEWVVRIIFPETSHVIAGFVCFLYLSW